VKLRPVVTHVSSGVCVAGDTSAIPDTCFVPEAHVYECSGTLVLRGVMLPADAVYCVLICNPYLSVSDLLNLGSSSSKLRSFMQTERFYRWMGQRLRLPGVIQSRKSLIQAYVRHRYPTPGASCLYCGHNRFRYQGFKPRDGSILVSCLKKDGSGHRCVAYFCKNCANRQVSCQVGFLSMSRPGEVNRSRRCRLQISLDAECLERSLTSLAPRHAGQCVLE
jgi:hypothetical protein